VPPLPLPPLLLLLPLPPLPPPLLLPLLPPPPPLAVGGLAASKTLKRAPRRGPPAAIACTFVSLQVGEVGVARCYQYNRHKGDPLCTAASPRPTTQVR
jgi:hypothetical protein